jgi:hypothetical protein
MLRVLRSITPILLAGAAAGIALWDWTYPLQLVSLLSGGRVYEYYTWRLPWSAPSLGHSCIRSGPASDAWGDLLSPGNQVISLDYQLPQTPV